MNTTGKIVRNLKDGFEILDADKDSYATLVKQGCVFQCMAISVKCVVVTFAGDLLRPQLH